MTPVVLEPDPVAPGTAIVLDPAEVASDRVELELNGGAIRVTPDGLDWGDAAIEQYMAEQARGQLPVDFRVPNRQIVIPLLLGATAAADLPTCKQQLQAKVALIQREGGWLKRGNGLYADITGATLKMPDRYGFVGVETDVVLTLEALPDFYGDEAFFTAAAGTAGDAELVFTVAGVDGDYPARTRIVVTNGSQRQRGLIGAIRSRYYSADDTAACAYEAEDMTPLDAAVTAALAGAHGSGSNTVKHASLSQQWTAVLGLDRGGDALTHRGTYRVWARCYTTAATPPRARLVWEVGDLLQPEENDPQRLPVTDGFALVNLGEVRLDAAPAGAHRWLGQIQAAADIDGDDIWIDKIWLFNADEAYFELSAPAVTTEGLVTYYARDGFTGTTAGSNLTGRTPPLGSAWITSGATGDFQFLDEDTGDEGVARAVAGTRYAVLGSSRTDQQVLADVAIPGAATPPAGGALARFTDANNHLRLTVSTTIGFTTRTTITLTKVVAGTPTELDSRNVSGGAYKLRLSVTATGAVTAIADGPTTVEMTAQDSALATAGALASGKGGIIDIGASSTLERRYDNVAVTEVPSPPGVIQASRKLEIRTDGIIRETAAGGSYGAVQAPIGDLPRLPPSGLENRTVEVILKPSRGDLDQVADSGLDAVTAQVFYRSSWLFPPAA